MKDKDSDRQLKVMLILFALIVLAQIYGKTVLMNGWFSLAYWASGTIMVIATGGALILIEKTYHTS